MLLPMLTDWWTKGLEELCLKFTFLFELWRLVVEFLRPPLEEDIELCDALLLFSKWPMGNLSSSFCSPPFR